MEVSDVSGAGQHLTWLQQGAMAAAKLMQRTSCEDVTKAGTQSAQCNADTTPDMDMRVDDCIDEEAASVDPYMLSSDTIQANGKEDDMHSSCEDNVMELDVEQMSDMALPEDCTRQKRKSEDTMSKGSCAKRKMKRTRTKKVRVGTHVVDSSQSCEKATGIEKTVEKREIAESGATECAPPKAATGKNSKKSVPPPVPPPLRGQAVEGGISSSRERVAKTEAMTHNVSGGHGSVVHATDDNITLKKCDRVVVKTSFLSSTDSHPRVVLRKGRKGIVQKVCGHVCALIDFWPDEHLKTQWVYKDDISKLDVLEAGIEHDRPPANSQARTDLNVTGDEDNESKKRLALFHLTLLARLHETPDGIANAVKILPDLYKIDPKLRTSVKAAGGLKSLCNVWGDVVMEGSDRLLFYNNEPHLDKTFLDDLQHQLVSSFHLKDRDFNPRHHFVYHEGQEYATHRGGFMFQPPPPGSVKLALSVCNYASDHNWLDRDSGWPVAYHGTNADENTLLGIVREGLRIRGGYEDARVGERYGQGVYVSPDPHVAALYCDKPFLVDDNSSLRHLRGKCFHIVVQCRVRPGAFVKTRAERVSWRVPYERDVRHCGLLLLRSYTLACRHDYLWSTCCGQDWSID